MFFHLFIEKDEQYLADCDGYSFLLYAIALEYDLPIVPVLTDKHVYVIWELNKQRHIKYETLFYRAFVQQNSIFEQKMLKRL